MLDKKFHHSGGKISALLARSAWTEKHNTDDVLMLHDLFGIELTGTDCKIWHPNKPDKAPRSLMRQHNHTVYYGQDFYVFIADVAKHGAYTLHLQSKFIKSTKSTGSVTGSRLSKKSRQLPNKIPNKLINKQKKEKNQLTSQTKCCCLQ